MKKFFIFLLPIFYFLGAWGIPWEQIQPSGTNISISYLFDVLFFIAIFYIVPTRFELGKIDLKRSLLLGAFILFFAALCIYITVLFGLNSPFKFVDNLVLQILILAPIVEEFIFRGSLFNIYKKLKVAPKLLIGLSAVLFSLSHLPAIWFLPEEFHHYIFFQLVYTAILGAVCAYSRFKSKNLIEPVLLHLIFNLCFYFAVQNSLI